MQLLPVPVQPVVSAAVVAPVPAGAVRVALLKTSSDAELVDRVVQNCFEKLEGQAVSSETFTVASLEQLPYAANKLTEFGGFDGVICFGFLNTQEPQFPALSAALTQSFIDISVKNVRPVVRAVFWRAARGVRQEATKDSMSTLTSTDMGELKRPSTRVHAPPGGGSSWSFGGDSAPAPTGRKHLSQAQVPAQEDVKMESPPPAPTSSDAEIVDGAVQNCLAKLQVSSETFTVATLEQLPYAANKLTEFGGFDGVICFGFLNTQDPQFAALNAALTQSLIKISVKNVRPVVQAVLISESRVASVKVRSGWGAEYAEGVVPLINLGGFVGPIAHSASGAPVKKHMEISRGNVLPAKLLRGSKTVLQSLEMLRDSLYEHGARGIRGLGRKFRIVDDDGNRSLSLEEFSKAIREHALDLTEKEVEELFHFIDANNSGGVNFDEFLLAVRGELNERRTQLVLMAFKILDADGSGVVDLNDVKGKYNVKQHPDVLQGRKTEDEVLLEFLDTFDGGEKDGKVHPNEFVRYYANVSASIDDDDYFELMIRNAWHISGGEGWSANTTCRRVLVTHADGSHTIEEVKNDLGIAAGNVEAIRANLQAQGINDIKSVSTSGSVQAESDANKRSNDSFHPQVARKKQHGAGQSSIIFG
ncbi:Calcyphosin-like protein [Phytophthora ramorum]|uniref:Calcyphosin-like protein n=1 Tax=Phytophthora ramorum TaxID=164328 RepID=UPI0030A8815B|nr:Calcyphosin-like protein [Phytophthora ramorum]